MAIIVSIVIIVAYCVYDRQRANDRQKVKEINDRINASNLRLEALELQVDVLCASLSGEIRDEFVKNYDAAVKPSNE